MRLPKDHVEAEWKIATAYQLLIQGLSDEIYGKPTEMLKLMGRFHGQMLPVLAYCRHSFFLAKKRLEFNPVASA